MNLNIYYTKVYKNETAFRRGKNKPNSNPIPERPKMNVNQLETIDYENISNWTLGQNKPNQTQSSTTLIRVLYTLRGPAPKLHRLLIKKQKKYEN